MNDPRTLKRQYLEQKDRAGVYAIRNLRSGRARVGASADVQAALNRHRFELRIGRHRDAQLRQDWAEHGEASFLFEVLDRVRPREEPGFDAAQELAAMLLLWRDEIPCRGAAGYGAAGEPA